jgi:hypothetical protein
MKVTDTATAAGERVLSDDAYLPSSWCRPEGCGTKGCFETQAPAVGITCGLLVDTYGSEHAS